MLSFFHNNIAHPYVWDVGSFLSLVFGRGIYREARELVEALRSRQKEFQSREKELLGDVDTARRWVTHHAERGSRHDSRCR